MRGGTQKDSVLAATLRRILLAVILVLIARAWLVQGVFFPVLVTGDSMAPALRGAHRRVACDHCRHDFAMGIAAWNPSRAVECPVCRHYFFPPRGGQISPAARVFVDRTAFWWQPPRRFELTVLRDPEQSQRLVVKRVAGLPGETVRIAEGDLWIDGQRWRKSREVRQELAIPVYNSLNKRDTAVPGELYWQADEEGSNWRTDEKGIYCEPRRTAHETGDKNILGPLDWLTLRRRPRTSENSLPLVDNSSGENPHVSHRPREVRDLRLNCHVTCQGSGSFVVAFDPSGLGYRAEILPGDSRLKIYKREQLLLDKSVAHLSAESSWDLEVSWVDGVWELLLNGKVMLRDEVAEHDLPRSATASPPRIAFAAQSVAAKIGDLRISRDIVYLAAPAPHEEPSEGICWRLGPDEFFVLGDNPLVSRDSRAWSANGHVTLRDIVGKPLPLTWPW